MVMCVRIMFVLVVRRGVYMVQRGPIAVDDHVNLGSCEAAAADSPHFEMRAEIQRGRCFFEQGKRHARIHKRAKQHVAADAGEALQISDSHGNEIVPRTGLMRRVHQIAKCLGPALLSGPILPV